jgi:hypothetical protein
MMAASWPDFQPAVFDALNLRNNANVREPSGAPSAYPEETAMGGHLRCHHDCDKREIPGAD